MHSYQLAIIRIARALADDVIDARKATALLYAMQLAGYQLNEFAKQRAEVEDPQRALKNEISARYDARKYPFPSYVPEQDLVSILKELRVEQSAEANEIDSSHAERSEAPMHFGPAQCTDPSSDSRPPQDDKARGCEVPQGRLAGSPARSAGNPDPQSDRVPEGRTGLDRVSKPPQPERPPTPHATGDWRLATDFQSIDPSSDLRPPQDDSREQPGAA